MTLYQPKALRNRAVPRLTTLNVKPQVGVKVSGVSAPSCHGSRPVRWVGMQVLSLTAWKSVVSQVPVGTTHGPGGGHAGPMLQPAPPVHSHASSAASPVGSPPAHPICDGICAPLGCVSGAPRATPTPSTIEIDSTPASLMEARRYKQRASLTPTNRARLHRRAAPSTLRSATTPPSPRHRGAHRAYTAAPCRDR